MGRPYDSPLPAEETMVSEPLEEPDVRRDRSRTTPPAAVNAALLRIVEAVHEATDADGVARATLEGLHALLPETSAAVLWFGGDAVPSSGRTLEGPLEADAVARVGAQLGDRLRADGRTGGPVVVEAGVIAGDGLRTLVRSATQRLHVVPVAHADAVLGALLVTDDADGDAAGRAVPWLAYLGRVLGHVVAALRPSGDDGGVGDVAGLRAVVEEMNDLGTIVRSIADAVNVAVMFYDTDNRPRLHNRMVEKILGLTGYDAATGMSTHVYASDRRTPVKRDKDIVSETIEGDQRGVIYWVGDPDEGEQRAVITDAHRISRPDGTPLGSAVVTYDVTDLANAIEVREEYLTTVSHELRTPLTSIVGYLDLIADTHDIAELGFEREFGVIQRNAEHLVTLVNDLASADAREQRLRIEPVDLTALVAQAIGTLQPSIDEAGHELRLELPSSALLGRADAARITQVINNLVSNAVKYTPRGGVITVSLARDGEDALLRVSDTGRGINRNDQARIFDRFFRAEAVREAAIQGVGVGLTIAKTIVDAHGGAITVHSAPDNGSTFTVRLPLRPAGAPLSTVSDQL